MCGAPALSNEIIMNCLDVGYKDRGISSVNLQIVK